MIMKAVDYAALREQYPWLGIVDSIHRGRPASAGNVIEELSGVAKAYIVHTNYNPPNALDPEAKDEVIMRPSVLIALKSSSFSYSFNLPRAVAKQLYEELRKIYG